MFNEQYTEGDSHLICKCPVAFESVFNFQVWIRISRIKFHQSVTDDQKIHVHNAFLIFLVAEV